MELTLTELEQLINHWRGLRPSTGEEHALSTEVNLLANVYALMIFDRKKSLPLTSLDSSVLPLVESWRSRTA